MSDLRGSNPQSDLALAPRGDDVRVAAGAAPMTAEDAAPNPLELVLDRLHGRWVWCGFVALLLAPALAVGGYLLTPIIWTGQGIIAVERKPEEILTRTPEMDQIDVNAFVGEQTLLLRSDRVIDAAMKDGRLQPFGRRLAQEQAGAILGGLNIAPAKGTGFISVLMESDDPQFSAAVVNSVMAAYMRIAGPEGQRTYTKTLSQLRDRLSETRRQIDQFSKERLNRIKQSPYGTPNLQAVIDERVKRMQALDSEIAEVDAAMRRIRDAQPAGDGEPAATATLEPTPADLDRANPALPQVRRDLQQVSMQLDLASKSYSKKHPIYQSVEKKVEFLKTQIGKEQEAARLSWNGGPGRTLSYGLLSKRRGDLMTDLSQSKADIDGLNLIIADCESLGRQIAQLEGDSKDINERIKGLETESDAIRRGRVTVKQDAVTPSLPSKDRRKQMAAVGGVGGCVASFALFFLWGTLDKRTYGTRQLAGTNPGKLLCAGALPDMNEVTEDAQAKDLASNCVHRIRTRIESRRSPGDGYALMVSSPFQGDGKTTLAVALAWSYAESGYRTLLVDCDFIGQALSFQFGRLGAAGVREALQGEDPAGLIAPAGTSNLSILSVGRDRTFGASRVHPTGLRRLFRELRNRFDIIVVDTGPMTASIEALPVASSVDGVILSLRRGRSRQRLEECIADITSVGAEYLGVVLNYAEKKDCLRYGSVSRMSIEITRALEGKTDTHAPKHPLLAAIRTEEPPRNDAAGDAA